MTIYISKGSSPIVCVATHTDDQIWIDPVAKYGQGAYIICDYGGPPGIAIMDPVDQGGFEPPAWTDQIESDSIKLECRRRITQKVSDQAQRNIVSHINDIQIARMSQSPIRPATPAEQSDMDTAAAIWAWIGAATRDPNSMLGASDAMIANHEHEFFQDVMWPAWNTAWDSFVSRF